jgi:hypothetical protein
MKQWGIIYEFYDHEHVVEIIGRNVFSNIYYNLDLFAKFSFYHVYFLFFKAISTNSSGMT